MADTATAAPESFPPISLLANSYDLQDLLKATLHAEGLKTPDKRDELFATIATTTAKNQDVIEGLQNGAVPEGTEIAEVEDAQGRTVTAAVALPAEHEDVTEGVEEPVQPASLADTATTGRRTVRDAGEGASA